MSQILTFAAHAAVLDPLSGVGLLTLPDGGTNVVLPGDPGGLHGAAYDAALSALAAYGWQPLEHPADGGELYVSLPHGEALALCMPDGPIHRLDPAGIDAALTALTALLAGPS